MKNFSIRHGKTFRDKSVSLLTLFTLGSGLSSLSAQTVVVTDQVSAQPTTDRIVPFRLSEQGVVRPVEWGLDTAWEDEGNMRRGTAFMEQVDLVRVSLRPTDPIMDGDLGADQKEHIQKRLKLLTFTNPDAKLTINSDHPKIDPFYKGNAQAWAQMMDLHTRYFQEGGRKVVSVAPFNEPDYVYTGQGTREDFYNIANELKKNPLFDNIRICGGNTLNCDEALPWYNFLKDRLDEGNTHQLAGGFDGYAGFFEAVRKDGKHATADEMHMSWKLWSGWNMACKQVSGGEVRSMPVVSSVKPVVVSVWHMPNIVLTGRQHPYTVPPMVKCRLSAEFPNVRLRQQATDSFQKRKMYSSMVMVHNVNLFWKCREAPVMEQKIRKMQNG